MIPPENRRILRYIKYSTHKHISRIQVKQISDHVVLKGVVNGQEKHKELLDADILILPTDYINEAQPVCIIEALAYGCVVISTTHRGIPEMLDYGNAGILIKPNSSECIADSVFSLANNPSLMQKYRQHGYTQYTKLFSAQSHWHNMKNVLLV